MLPVEFYSLSEDIDVIGRENIRIGEGEMVREWELVELNTRTRMVK